jgi:hypothetical protein
VQLSLSCGHPNFEIPTQSITEVEEREEGSEAETTTTNSFILDFNL